MGIKLSILIIVVFSVGPGRGIAGEADTYQPALLDKTENPIDPVVVTVPKIVALPGQLKSMPADKPVQSTQPVGQVIEEGNQQSRQKPSKESFVNAITVYDYEEGALYQLYAAPKMFTEIILQPGEVPTSEPQIGDSARWTLSASKSYKDGVPVQHLLIKPHHAGLKTSIGIYTNKRSYRLEAHSFQNTYMAQVKWHYPREQARLLIAKLQQERAMDAATVNDSFDVEALDFQYKVETLSGPDPVWKPLSVFNNGEKVYVQFPESLHTSEAPVLFILKRKGKAQLVNYRVKGLYYEIDRLFDRAELRVGDQEQDVVRITYLPAKRKHNHW